MNYIEIQLDEKTQNFSEGRKYYIQWQLTKEYMPKVLHTITQYFPHYSLHDDTHSEAILNNIVRITGEDVIKRLSIVDLWYLLTAAYYHDSGMTLKGEEIDALLKEGSDLVDYIREKQEDTSSALYVYAQQLEIREGKIYYKDALLTKTNLDAVRFLIADFTRGQHGKRSADKIDTAASLHLPGQPIPERITRLLGKICSAHTQTQKKLLMLPKVESSGCGTEDCHPLYIACLLRLGDLLDIDTNRVSDVLLSSLPSIPADSQAYNQSNRSITHIRVDSSIIEMTAECEDDDPHKAYLAAKLTSDWFQMIDEEITFQTKHWYEIVPDKCYGSLPATGKMEVHLKGYDNFDGKKRPHFTVNASKAIEMLQGANLYSDPSQCIRELLQNAVDATYLRIYEEQWKGKMDDEGHFKDANEAIIEFQRLCQLPQYQIFISLDKDKEKSDDKTSYWQFSLKDNGIGMSEEDLEFLYNTGSGSKNREKQRIIKEMPDWMRPSGTFGIGFQSVFLITDKVRMTTRRWGREASSILDLYNPSGKEKGNILKRTTVNNSIPFGTKIEFDISKLCYDDNNDDNYDDDYYYGYASSGYDFARHNKSDILISNKVRQLIEILKALCSNLHILVNIAVVGKLATYNKKYFDYYDENTGLQVRGKLNVNSYPDQKIHLFFRNQCIPKYTIASSLFHWDINILKGNAKDILTLNREHVQSKCNDYLQKEISYATCRYLIDKFGDLNDEVQMYAAAYIEQNGNLVQDFYKKIHECPKYYWKNIKVDSYTIDKLIGADRIENEYEEGAPDSLCFYYEGSNQIKIYNRGNAEIYDFVCRMLSNDDFPSFQYHNDRIYISKEPTTYYDYIANDKKSHRNWLYNVYMTDLANGDMRSYMPCNKRYKFLEITGSHDEPTFKHFGYNYPKMVCPFIHTGYYDGLEQRWEECRYDDNVIDFVYENRANKNVTKKQIAETYKLFRQDWQAAVDEVNKEAEKKE